MPELSLPDVTLHYEVDGTGPALILLAGMLSDSASWAPLLPALTQQFTVVRPDNRSTGRTTPWDAPASVQHYAQDAAALMAHLGHDRYHVVGHSMGGLITTELAGMHRDRVASIAMLASAPVRSPRTFAIFETLRDIRKAPGGETLWLRALYPWVFAPDFFAEKEALETAIEAALGYPHGQSAAAMVHQIEVLRGYRPTVKLADIRAPAMALHAEHEILIPRDAAQEAFRAIPDIEQHIIPGAGHSIHWGAPDAVAERIAAFCKAH